MTRKGKKHKKTREEHDLAKRYDFSEGVKLALPALIRSFIWLFVLGWTHAGQTRWYAAR
jgi:hypothetical protein